VEKKNNFLKLPGPGWVEIKKKPATEKYSAKRIKEGGRAHEKQKKEKSELIFGYVPD